MRPEGSKRPLVERGRLRASTSSATVYFTLRRAQPPLLAGEGKDEGGNGGQHAEEGEPHGGGAGEEGVSRLDLLGFYIDNIILLEIVIGRVKYLGIIDVQLMILTLALRILTDQENLVTLTIEIQIAGTGDGLNNTDLLIRSRIDTRHFNSTQHRIFVIGHTDLYDRIFRI